MDDHAFLLKRMIIKILRQHAAFPTRKAGFWIYSPQAAADRFGGGTFSLSGALSLSLLRLATGHAIDDAQMVDLAPDSEFNLDPALVGVRRADKRCSLPECKTAEDDFAAHETPFFWRYPVPGRLLPHRQQGAGTPDDRNNFGKPPPLPLLSQRGIDTAARLTTGWEAIWARG